jgi:hypothetical protein
MLSRGSCEENDTLQLHESRIWRLEQFLLIHVPLSKAAISRYPISLGGGSKEIWT